MFETRSDSNRLAAAIQHKPPVTASTSTTIELTMDNVFSTPRSTAPNHTSLNFGRLSQSTSSLPFDTPTKPKAMRMQTTPSTSSIVIRPRRGNNHYSPGPSGRLRAIELFESPTPKPRDSTSSQHFRKRSQIFVRTALILPSYHTQELPSKWGLGKRKREVDELIKGEEQRQRKRGGALYSDKVLAGGETSSSSPGFRRSIVDFRPVLTIPSKYTVQTKVNKLPEKKYVRATSPVKLFPGGKKTYGSGKSIIDGSAVVKVSLKGAAMHGLKGLIPVDTICYNCTAEGHSFMDCVYKCGHCGRDGHRTIDCIAIGKVQQGACLERRPS